MFCKYCGTKVEDDALFCSKCGSKLSDNATNTVSEEPKSNTEETNADIIVNSNSNGKNNVNIYFREIYNECDCSYPWASYDNDYLFIDSNPYNYDSDSFIGTMYLDEALAAIKKIHAALNLPSYLYSEMGETRGLDGTRAYTGKKDNVTWRYSPSTGLEVRYTLK